LIKISVVTVTYNALQLLEETMKSVTAQDYSHIEYIVIDGGSTDGTPELIKQYADHLDYWVSEPDDGIYYAMNKAIEKATGDYIVFMNAGDVFVNGSTLSFVAERCGNSPEVDLLYGDMYVKNDKGNTLVKVKPFNEFWEVGMPFCHQSLYTRTSLMKAVKFDTCYKLSSDYDFILKCYHRGAKFEYVDEPLCIFLEEGKTLQQRSLSLLESMKIVYTYLDDKKQLPMSPVTKTFLAMHSENANFAFSKSLNRLMQQALHVKRSYGKIALYGYGTVAQTILPVLDDSVTVIADQNAASVDACEYELCMPQLLSQYDFECILITVLGREEEISAYLDTLGIERNKIIFFRV